MERVIISIGIMAVITYLIRMLPMVLFTSKIENKTVQSTIELVRYLMKKYHVSADHVIRHYDVTRKICPKYFVEHEDAWKQFKGDVGVKLEKLKEYQ